MTTTVTDHLDCRVCQIGVLAERDRGLHAALFVCGHCGEAWVLDLVALAVHGVRRSAG